MGVDSGDTLVSGAGSVVGAAVGVESSVGVGSGEAVASGAGVGSGDAVAPGASSIRLTAGISVTVTFFISSTPHVAESVNQAQLAPTKNVQQITTHMTGGTRMRRRSLSIADLRCAPFPLL